MKILKSRYSKTSRHYKHRDSQWADGQTTSPSPTTFLILFGVLMFAIVMLVITEEVFHSRVRITPQDLQDPLLLTEKLRNEPPTLKVVLEHLFSAMIVASVMGFTYERLSHQHREKAFGIMFERHEERVFNMIKVSSPTGIFNMLESIIKQLPQTPTLYSPAREEEKEYTFADSISFFEMLVKARRQDVINELRRWIGLNEHHNLKFLASDFIGKFELEELKDELYEQARQGSKRMTDIDRGWILNYMWAYSRFEKPKYKLLEEKLLEADKKTQAWILFVPIQMEDPEFLKIIDNYLDSRGKEIDDDNLILAARALAALQRVRLDGHGVLKKSSNLFKSDKVLDEVRKQWIEFRLPEELQERMEQQSNKSIDQNAPL
jgi:hypothetical protein